MDVQPISHTNSNLDGRNNRPIQCEVNDLLTTMFDLGESKRSGPKDPEVRVFFAFTFEGISFFLKVYIVRTDYMSLLIVGSTGARGDQAREFGNILNIRV
jgi:hypothetical protein